MIRQRRGMTSTDMYYMLLIVAFIVIGSYALVKMNSIHSLDEEFEGIGFRQSAVLNTYELADKIHLYTEITARYAVQGALLQFQEDGGKALNNLKQDLLSPCGYVGPYTSWTTDNSECYKDISMTEVDPLLKEYIDQAMAGWWDHPVVRNPVSYRYYLSLSREGLKLVGVAQEEIVLPILGVKDGLSQVASSIMAQESLSSATSTIFSPDARISGVLVSVTPDADRRTRAGDRPTQIIVHYSRSTSLAEEVEKLKKRNGVSMHYLVSTPDENGAVRVVQMVPEDEVADQSDCSDARCALVGTNEKTIAVMLINRAWLDPALDQAVPPDGENSNKCAVDGYIVKARDCSHASYNNYEIYNGRQECLNENKNHKCWQNYPPEQIEVAHTLIADIATRHNILPENIIGYDQVRADSAGPGPLFDFVAVKTAVSAYEGQSPDVTPPTYRGDSLLWPMEGFQINSCYGPRADGDGWHDGIDINSAPGKKVFSVADGTVMETCNEWTETNGCACSIADSATTNKCPNKASCYGKCGNFGNTVLVKHNDELYSKYSHLASVSVREGDSVRAGETIGFVGSTGYSTGTHLDLKIFTEADDLKKGAVEPGENPFCFFDQDTLLRLSAWDGADSCVASYGVDGEAVLNLNNPKLQDECNKIGFGGVERSGCFSTAEVDVTKINSKEESAIIAQTLSNFDEFAIQPIIDAAAEEYKIDKFLIMGIITQESKGEPEARSQTGPAGIMQFNAGTARDSGLKVPTACCNGDEALRKVCHKEEIYNSSPQKCLPVDPVTKLRDERFFPELAIPAGARHLKKLLNHYERSKSEQLYYAIQAYNSGASAMNKSIIACGGEGVATHECLKVELKKLNPGIDTNYPTAVLTHMAAWGGSVSGVTSDVQCEDVDVKNLGSLRFKPNFAIIISDALSPMSELVSWAKEQASTRTDDIHELADIEDLALDDWTVSAGFCEESRFDNYLSRIILGLQECSGNNQDSCSCPVLPLLDEEAELDDGEYELVFVSDGAVELVSIVELANGAGLERGRLSSARFPPLTVYYYEKENGDQEPKEVYTVNFPFSVSAGVVVQKPAFYKEINDEGKAEPFDMNHNPVGFFKIRKDELWGVYDIDDYSNGVCLPTARLHPVCAVGDVELANGEDAQAPVVKFGLTLSDSHPPANPTNALLDADELGNLAFSFKLPDEDDLSGVLVDCSLGAFDEGRYYFSLRLSLDDLDESTGLVRIPITECNGEPINKVAGAEYFVRARSFDFGANENDEDSSCGNTASFSFTEEYMSYMSGGTGFVYEDLLAAAMGCSLGS